MSALFPEVEKKGKAEGLTAHGYREDEVVSALQKAVRAGDEERAGFFAYELAESGKAWRLWRRLKIIAAEDVGGMLPLVFVAQAQWAARDAGGEATMIAMRAAIELARWVRKHGGDRTADDMRCAFDERFREGWKGLPIQDVDLDGHTRRGRSMGRGDGFFWRVSSRLAKEAPDYDKRWIGELRERYKERA